MVDRGDATKRWVKVATTYDGQNVAIYIAGVQNVVQPFGPIPMMQLESNLLIGAGLAHGRPSGATSLHGYIARVDVWDRCLSAAEITQYMSAIPALDAPGIRAACWLYKRSRSSPSATVARAWNRSLPISIVASGLATRL